MYWLNKLRNCGIYQGENKTSHYFEGWYFKHVDGAQKNVISIIPGISYENSREKSHAFIQVIDGRLHKTYYIKYDINDFSFSKEGFEIRIDDNVFSNRGIDLNIKDKDLQIHGRLRYSNHVNWPSTLLSPNSMGWYAYIPVMECYHGVLSLRHDLQGFLEINNENINFDGGKGYMEKDWGTSFPSSWIWLQSNHFTDQSTSLMLSVARIPWRGRSFTGFIAGLWHKGKLYRFATYTGAKINYIKSECAEISIRLSDGRYAIVVKAQQSDTGVLLSPVKGAMIVKLQESVNATASVMVYDAKKDRQIFNENACCCGLEIAGNIKELLF